MPTIQINGKSECLVDGKNINSSNNENSMTALCRQQSADSSFSNNDSPTKQIDGKTVQETSFQKVFFLLVINVSIFGVSMSKQKFFIHF